MVHSLGGLNCLFFFHLKIVRALLEILLGSILNLIKQLGDGCACAGHI